MALINKTGITDGGTIQAAHVTRSIDALSGGSTDTIMATGSFSGSFKGTLIGSASFATSSSRAVSSSFATTATTASYALNAGSGGESTTLAFFHTEVTNTTSGSITYIGGFGSAPLSSANRIGMVVPYNGTVTHTWASSFAPTTGTCLIDLDLMKDGTLVDKVAQDLDLSGFTDKTYTNDVEYSVSAGQLLTIRITEKNTSTAVWNINAGIVIVRV